MFDISKRDVGMVHCVSETMGSCRKNQHGSKLQEQERVFHDIVTTQVNICQLQDTLDTFSPFLHLAAF